MDRPCSSVLWTQPCSSVLWIQPCSSGLPLRTCHCGIVISMISWLAGPAWVDVADVCTAVSAVGHARTQPQKTRSDASERGTTEAGKAVPR